MNKTIPLTLPEGVWGRLATKADKEGRKVADVLADAISEALNPKPRIVVESGAELPDRPALPSSQERWAALVASGHKAGWTDQEMAVAFEREYPGEDWTRNRVSVMRRALRLPPNKQFKRVE